MPEAFGARLARLRSERTVPAARPRRLRAGGVRTRIPLSQNELAARAGITAGYVNKLERSASSPPPSRWVVERLAEALELAELDTALLLIAAGYWPWPELDEDETAIAVGVLLAVAAGDCRRLEGVAHLDAHKTG
jgi:transcriptional regulator with XRE-family HTH domain